MSGDMIYAENLLQPGEIINITPTYPQYTVVHFDFHQEEGRSVKEFYEEVESKLKDGWKCQGGVHYRNFDGSISYKQAMTKGVP